MAYFPLLAFALLAVTLPHVLSVPSFGGYAPLYPGYPGGGYEKKPLTLTCAINFTDSYKKNSGIVNAIAVTIKEKSSPYGGIKSSLLSYVGYGSLTGSGLTAVIELYSAIGGSASVAFTERAKPEKGCYPEDFGYFLTPKSDYGGGYAIGGGGYGIGGGGYAIGNYGGYGTGNYGSYGTGNYGSYGGGNYGSGYGSYGGYGMGGGLSGMGGSYGGGYSGGGGYGAGGDDYSESVPGVVAKVNLSPGTSSSINIDNLAGFSYLKELAGRGVIVCPTKAVKGGYHGAECEGGILACCALHYDHGEQSLGGKYDGY